MSAKLISAADKLHNARSILRDLSALGEQLWARFNAGRDEILWYYRSVVEALRQQPTSSAVEGLAQEIQKTLEAIAAAPSLPQGHSS